MKKGLYIANGLYVNLEHLGSWSINKQSIHLQLTPAYELNFYDICIEGSGLDGTPVTTNEFKRIEREISEYMGITCNLTSQHVRAI